MYNDYPFNTIKLEMETYAKRGLSVYQKFTCDHCGSRQTMAEKNTLFIEGACEECSHITDIYKKGCNYMVVGNFNEMEDLLKDS